MDPGYSIPISVLAQLLYMPDDAQGAKHCITIIEEVESNLVILVTYSSNTVISSTVVSVVLLLFPVTVTSSYFSYFSSITCSYFS